MKTLLLNSRKSNRAVALLLALPLALMASMAVAQQAPREGAVNRPPGSPTLKVIADHGGKSARPYYAPISGAGVSDNDGYSAQIGPTPPPPHQGPYSEADMLPVRSDQLTPGTVESRPLQLPGGFTPIFIIGDDDLSRQWLQVRGDALRKLHAVGLVVNVDNEQALNELRKDAQGLELQPAHGNDLAGRLGLQHYPVLISANGLEQ